MFNNIGKIPGLDQVDISKVSVFVLWKIVSLFVLILILEVLFVEKFLKLLKKYENVVFHLGFAWRTIYWVDEANPCFWRILYTHQSCGLSRQKEVYPSHNRIRSYWFFWWSRLQKPICPVVYWLFWHWQKRKIWYPGSLLF